MGAAVKPFVCYVDDLGFYIGDAERIAHLVGAPKNVVIELAKWVTTKAPDRTVLVKVPNVEAFWKVLRYLARLYYASGNPVPTDQTIHLVMPCGHVTRYIAFDDVPWHNTPCPCGNPAHWLIRYTKQKS